MKKKSRRGFTLLELIVVSAISILVISGGVIMSISKNGGSASADRNTFISAMTDATGLASASGNGATIVYAPAGAVAAELDVYSGQPNGGAMSATPLRRYKLMGKISAVAGQNTVSASNFAIFIDGYSRATHGTWTAGSSTIAIPPCTVAGTPLVITYDGGTSSLSCGASTFVSTANGRAVVDPT